MVGNVLIVRGDNLTGAGVATYDISDPTNPVLMDKLTSRSYAYGGSWTIGRAYDAMPMFGNMSHTQAHYFSWGFRQL